jgi:hypothetical protein
MDRVVNREVDREVDRAVNRAVDKGVDKGEGHRRVDRDKDTVGREVLLEDKGAQGKGGRVVDKAKLHRIKVVVPPVESKLTTLGHQHDFDAVEELAQAQAKFPHAQKYFSPVVSMATNVLVPQRRWSWLAFCWRITSTVRIHG